MYLYHPTYIAAILDSHFTMSQVLHRDGLPCRNGNRATGAREIEPAAENRGTSVRRTCQHPGLIATQQIPLIAPIKDLWTDRLRGPSEGKTKYPGLCIAEDEA